MHKIKGQQNVLMSKFFWSMQTISKPVYMFIRISSIIICMHVREIGYLTDSKKVTITTIPRPMKYRVGQRSFHPPKMTHSVVNRNL